MNDWDGTVKGMEVISVIKMICVVQSIWLSLICIFEDKGVDSFWDTIEIYL